MITIRHAEKEDFPWILDLNQENEIWLTPLDEDLLSALADSAHMFLLAEADGQPAAFMIALRENKQVCQLKVYQWFNERYPSFLYIDRLVTHETFRGQGIGRLLYEKAEQKAAEDQLPVLAAAIETIPYNERSLGFHKAMGFEEAGRILVRNETVEVSLQTKTIPAPQPKLLYHGSVIEGLPVILAHSKSHTDDSRVAYFTTDRVYALVCCRTPEENFVTMGPKDGVQHYFERFPDQLKIMYEGREGFLYQPVSTAGLKKGKGNSWVSPADVPVILREHVLNVYEEILREELAGNVIIHRYNEIDPAEQKDQANYFRNHLDEPWAASYRDFLMKHFSPLWD